MGVGFDADGGVHHRTPVHGLELPPPVPGRVAPTFNGNGQYVLPDPETGIRKGWPRASTVAKALDDTYMLEAWRRRMMLIGMWQRGRAVLSELDEIIGTYTDESEPLARGLRTPLNRIAENLEHEAGASYGAEFGTATHAWCEWVDLGLGHVSDVPSMFRPWVLGHRRALARAGLRVLGRFTETMVINTQWGIVGTLDRVFLDNAGRIILGDIKTSGTLDHSWLYFAIQLAVYHGASRMWDHRTQSWVPMVALDPTIALISHLPRESPEDSAVVPIDMTFGASALRTAMTVRRLRSRADKYAQDVPYAVGLSDDRERRFHAARFELETSTTEDEMSEVWERYQDVWTDELTAIGRDVLRLVHATQSNAPQRNA